MSAPAGDGFDLSMNEIEMSAYKAARGAGLPWGVAEDTGRAARWLAALGVDWSTALIAALGSPAALDPARSPFLLGTRIADQIDALTADGTRCAAVADPVWLVALLAVCTAAAPPLAVDLGGIAVSIGAGGVWASVPAAGLAGLATAAVTARPAPSAALTCRLQPTATRGHISAERHAALEALVYRTYVPTSERSRLRGAGARAGA